MTSIFHVSHISSSKCSKMSQVSSQLLTKYSNCYLLNVLQHLPLCSHSMRNSLLFGEHAWRNSPSIAMQSPWPSTRLRSILARLAAHLFMHLQCSSIWISKWTGFMHIGLRLKWNTHLTESKLRWVWLYSSMQFIKLTLASYWYMQKSDTRRSLRNAIRSSQLGQAQLIEQRCPSNMDMWNFFHSARLSNKPLTTLLASQWLILELDIMHTPSLSQIHLIQSTRNPCSLMLLLLPSSPLSNLGCDSWLKWRPK